MQGLDLHLHAGLVSGLNPRARQGPRVPFLRQGSLDGSCGALCVYLALVILGVASLEEIQLLRRFEGGRLECTWLRMLDTYFLGATPAEIEGLLQPLCAEIAYSVVRGSMRAVVGAALEHLRNGQLVILGLRGLSEVGGHWVLAVGYEAVGDRAMALLLSDPSDEQPVLAGFNGRLDLQSPRRGAAYLRYATLGRSRRLVTCTAAIDLHRRDDS